MTVIYYTSTFFLDLSLDIINVLKQHVDLHVFIEVTSSSKNATVADIKEFPAGRLLAKPSEVLSAESFKLLSPYFKGTVSTHFVIHQHATGFSWSTLQASLAVWKFVKPYKPAIIHFEGYTLRSIGLLPFLFSVKKVFLAIHDPVPHTGESSWKISLPNLLFFRLPFKKYFIFYSDFARKLFLAHYKEVAGKKLLVKMNPYSCFKQQPNMGSSGGHILFFGRISPYKGVDVLLKAMPGVFDEFPDQKLVIAGKSANGYVLNDDELPVKYKSNIHIINRYIANDELTNLISEAKFVVCPYLDATQSGVLMTAFAFNKPVIASNVGSFPEFIVNNFNGLLVDPANPEALAHSIALALRGKHYEELTANVMLSNVQTSWRQSLATVMTEYMS